MDTTKTMRKQADGLGTFSVWCHDSDLNYLVQYQDILRTSPSTRVMEEQQVEPCTCCWITQDVHVGCTWRMSLVSVAHVSVYHHEQGFFCTSVFLQDLFSVLRKLSQKLFFSHWVPLFLYYCYYRYVVWCPQCENHGHMVNKKYPKWRGAFPKQWCWLCSDTAANGMTNKWIGKTRSLWLISCRQSYDKITYLS